MSPRRTHPEGAPAYDLPPQEAVFAPGPDPEMIAEVSAKLRDAAGLPKKPTRSCRQRLGLFCGSPVATELAARRTRP